MKVIVAGAGGAAHLPGMIASLTTLPVLGVPVESKALKGVDSLYSIVQMPGGVPVGTLAIGRAGAINAALLAASILALADPALDQALGAWRARQTRACRETPTDDPEPCDEPDPARCHDRHPRRRPARPHDRHGGRPARLSLPHLRTRGREPGRRRRRRLHARPYEDEAALAAFADAVDVVTLEFENVPVAAVERLARHRPVRPGAEVLRVTQDRLEEKGFVSRLGIPVTAYAPVANEADLVAARAPLGEGVLKTTRLGYDGKGQLRIRRDTDPGAALAQLRQPTLIFEAWVDFALELSVITARNPQGQQASYVPVENRHRHHILDVTIAPAAIPAALAAALAAEAVEMAERIAQALKLEGLLAVEMFLTSDGRLLVNELAPRPHNSGHWTIDACAVSQFEQQVRAVCDLPLGDPSRFADAEMQNLIGHDVERWPGSWPSQGHGCTSTASARRATAARWATSPGSGDDVGDALALKMRDPVLERELLLLQPLQLELVVRPMRHDLRDPLVECSMRGSKRIEPGINLGLDRPVIHRHHHSR